MRISRYWRLAILLLGLAGCGGISPASPAAKTAADHVESGNSALAKGEFDQALEEFTVAVDASVDSTIALERRAATYLQMKKYNEALADCNSALRIDNKSAAAYILRAQAQKCLGEKDKALADFTKALENSHERADVLTQRGEVYRSLATSCRNPDEAAKNLQKAKEDFDRAVRIDPNQAGLSLQRALVGLDIGDFAGAVADCDAALKAPALPEKKSGEDAQAHVARARGECELGEIEKAVADCDAAIHRDANCMEAYAIRAKARLENAAEMRTLEEVAQCSQAADDCQKAIELAKKFKGDPEGTGRARSIRALAHELRGLIYHNLQIPKRALDEYGRALLLDPYLVSALLHRAVSRFSADDVPGALNDCNEAISQDSARPDAYASRGAIYSWKSDYPKAIEDFTQAVQLDPKCAKAFYGRALVYALMANAGLKQARMSRDAAERRSCLEKAQELWKKSVDDATEAIQANHHMSKAYLTRGAVYSQLAFSDNRYLKKALQDYGSAIHEDPKMFNAYRNRAKLLFDVNLLDEGLKDLFQCQRLAPLNPQIAQSLMLVYQKKKDPILAPKYEKQYQELMQRARQKIEDLDVPADFTSRPKPARLPEVVPDIDVDPLQKAKDDLESKLEATAEKNI